MPDAVNPAKASLVSKSADNALCALKITSFSAPDWVPWIIKAYRSDIVWVILAATSTPSPLIQVLKSPIVVVLSTAKLLVSPATIKSNVPAVNPAKASLVVKPESAKMY